MSEDKFSANSRYVTAPTAEHTRPDGVVVTHLRRRFIPRQTGSVLAEHQVVEGDRPDTIAAAKLSDPEQYWRICDVNHSMHPRELVRDIGRILRIAVVVSGDQ